MDGREAMKLLSCLNNLGTENNVTVTDNDCTETTYLTRVKEEKNAKIIESWQKISNTQEQICSQQQIISIFKDTKVNIKKNNVIN